MGDVISASGAAATGEELPFNLCSWLIQKVTGSGEPDMVLNGVIMIVSALLCIVIPYLLGSINPAIIISQKYYGDDIRTHGSGNAGATNTLRTFGKKTAILIFLLDLTKAALAVLVGSIIMIRSIGGAIAGFFVILGHMFPIFFKFKGGKGVACTAMVMLLLSPLSFAILFPVFVIIVLFTRYVSLGSIMAVMLYPLFNHVFYSSEGSITLSAFFTMLLVVFMHRENIKRLLQGKESKLKLGKSKKEREAAKERLAKAAEREYSDADFTKCSCGRLIPVSRKTCAYCGAKNTNYVQKDK